MTLTVIGDFADPLSFLASQRVEQIRSLDLHDLRWAAVEADPQRAMGGRPCGRPAATRAEELRLDGETAPAAATTVPNTRAATAAYAESLTEGVQDAMRRALFDALWVQGYRLDDPEVIRAVAAAVFATEPPAHDLDRRIRANVLPVPLGGSEPMAASRRMGFLVSSARGPISAAGRRRVDTWRALWERHGRPELPVLVAEGYPPLAGPDALNWLAAQLPHPAATTRPTAACGAR